MFSLKPPDANDPQGLMRRKEPNKQTNKLCDISCTVRTPNLQLLVRGNATTTISTLSSPPNILGACNLEEIEKPYQSVEP